MASLVLGSRIVLAVVFATAGVGKLLDLSGSRRALADFGVPARVAWMAGLLLPLAELAVAAALVATPSARWGAVAALLLLLAFVLGIAHALSRGQAPDCHCFGQLESAPAGRGTLVRNAILAVPAAIVVLEGPGPSIGSWVSGRTDTELVAVSMGILAVALGVSIFRLWVDNRNLRGELATARAELANLPPGLPVDATAPPFTLSDTRGRQRSLQSLLAEGRSVALVFVSPDCGTCEQLLPEVGRWQETLADRLTVAVISRGTPNDNRAVTDGHVVNDLLVQEDTDVMRAYRVGVTPSAVIVSPEGRIASSPAEGSLAIEPLIRLTLRRGVKGPSVTQSRTQRRV